MTNRTITVSSPARISTRDGQLVLMAKDGKEKTIPLEDMASLLLEGNEISITVPALEALSENNVAVTICDSTHNPCTSLMTLHSNSVQTERYARQLSMPDEEKDLIWQQVIKAKLYNQAGLLNLLSKENGDVIERMIQDVVPGDATNREGAAARIYWKSLFGDEFKRDRFGAGLNPLLNYGYSILRSATARALMGSGMFPCQGIHHRNRYDDFPLADDMMEPYRPFVDLQVFKLNENGHRKTTKEVRTELQKIVYCEVILTDRIKELGKALTDTSSSLSRYIEKGTDILFPLIC